MNFNVRQRSGREWLPVGMMTRSANGEAVTEVAGFKSRPKCYIRFELQIAKKEQHVSCGFFWCCPDDTRLRWFRILAFSKHVLDYLILLSSGSVVT